MGRLRRPRKTCSAGREPRCHAGDRPSLERIEEQLRGTDGISILEIHPAEPTEPSAEVGRSPEALAKERRLPDGVPADDDDEVAEFDLLAGLESEPAYPHRLTP